MSGVKWIKSEWPGKAEWLTLQSRGLLGPMWLANGSIPRGHTEENPKEAERRTTDAPNTSN